MGLKTHNIQSFLGFRRFQFQFLEVSHSNAKEKCEQLKGRLAEPRTDEQFKAIQSFFSLSRLFWLGAVEQGGHRRFVYLSDGEEIPNSSPFWGHNEPNNPANDEFCVEYRNSGFNDEGCGNRRPFVCEFGETGNVSVCETGNDFLFY